jgi:hypothetical protein
MAKQATTAAVVEDVFAETPVAAPAAPGLAVIEVTPAAPVAPTPVAAASSLPVPEGWVYVEFLESYFNTTDKTLRFNTLPEVYAHINKASIATYVESFMAHVEANMESYFLVDAKPERKAKKAHVDENGVVTIPKGTVLPAEPARLMEGIALESAKTRLRTAAEKVIAWQYQQQSVQG